MPDTGSDTKKYGFLDHSFGAQSQQPSTRSYDDDKMPFMGPKDVKPNSIKLKDASESVSTVYPSAQQPILTRSTTANTTQSGRGVATQPHSRQQSGDIPLQLVIHEHYAVEPDELTIHQGDRVYVHKQREDGWVVVTSREGVHGVIPASCLKS